MSTPAIPERGAPPLPEDWPEGVHWGPAVAQGAVPTYLLDRGAESADPTSPEMTVISGGEPDQSETCDVVVVGSGAGGAVVAKELAEAGLRVIVLEKGGYYTSKDFTGPPIERILRMCQSSGATAALGKVVIPIPIGNTVGGTTTVNSGTCFRAPRRVLEAWERDHGLEGLSYEALEPHYLKVEEAINVRPVPWELLGPNGWITHNGARALGVSGGPILRNITHCHGAGQCAFGCPTDAKQAMHLTYLPRAARAGARIYERAAAEWILVERGRAVGIRARFMGAGEEPLGRLEVRARAVAVAGGAVGTPVFLLGNRLGGRSGQVGRNLSIHPATGVAGWFAEAVHGWRGTLQPYYIDELFDSHGAMLEATNSVPSVSANVFPGYGAPTKEVMATYAHMATLGLLVADSGRGRVRRGLGGDPLITYTLSSQDVANLRAGLALAAEVLLAAGAFSVTAGIPGLESIADASGVSALGEADIRPSALKLSAFHPVGTARMGTDPNRSVVGPSLESHEVGGLYVTDASVFPSCIGVNPQVTIMALAARAAEGIAARLL